METTKILDQLKNAKEIVCDSGRKLLERGLVEGTWGNCSLRIDNQLMAITPSGRRYEELNPDDIVIMDYHTLKVIEIGRASCRERV